MSIDYLTQPRGGAPRGRAGAEGRGPGGRDSSPNRCFPTKAVAIWHRLDDRGHMGLVEGYLEEAGNFARVRGVDRSPRRLFSDPLYAVIGRNRARERRISTPLLIEELTTESARLRVYCSRVSSEIRPWSVCRLFATTGASPKLAFFAHFGREICGHYASTT